MKFTYSTGEKPLDGYTIKRAIHRGGFGEVYYALTDAGKEVALKLLHDNMEVELRGVSQCLNLKHANLVTIFDIKTDAQDDHWIVMEYIAGETLAEMIAKSPAGLPKSEVAKLFKQCSEGLAFLHDRGLVHRDLKPANIFSEDRVLKIGDVGLSKFINQSQRSAHTQSVGTVYYMAPEVAKGKYGKGVDIYAMGIIAYEMLTGQVPFDGESTGEILMKHLTEKPDLSNIEKPIAEVIQKALEKDEQNRFDSISEFQLALQDAIEGKEIPAAQRKQAIDDGVQIGMQRSEKSPKKIERKIQSSQMRTQTVVSKNENRSPANLTKTTTVEQEEINGWSFWWVLALAVFCLLTTRNFFLTASVCALSAGSYYCFRRSIQFAKKNALLDRNVQRHLSDFEKSKLSIKQKIKQPSVRRERRTGRLLTSDMLQGIAIAPITICIIAASILFLSRDFFSSVWLPNQTDFAHVGFFVASSTFLVWVLLVLSRVQHRKYRSDHRRRFLNGAVGLLAGVAVFGLGEWFMIEYPRSIFPSDNSGMVSNIGRYALVSKQGTAIREIRSKGEGRHLQHSIVSDQGLVIAKLESNNEQDHTSIEDSVSESASARSASVDDEVSQIARERSLYTPVHFSPTLAGYASFFCCLFAWRTWWPMSDFERSSHFRLWAIVFTAMVAYLVCCVLTFPTVWAMTWAATIAATLQIASPSRQRN